MIILMLYLRYETMYSLLGVMYKCKLKFRCEELGLLKRCHRVPSRSATEAELLKLHSPQLHLLVKKTHTETDAEELEKLSSNYDATYFHPVSNDV